MKLAQKVVAKAGEPRSWRRHLSELQTSFAVLVGVGELEVEVEDFVELGLLREELEEVLECVEEWEEEEDDDDDDEDEDFVLEVEVRVEEDETSDFETQRIWPTERSQFASRVGFQAYS